MRVRVSTGSTYGWGDQRGCVWQAAAVLEPSVAHDLAGRLRDAGYDYDAVAERLGPEGLNGLARNATIPADRALAGAGR